jgi:hypothetical protein
MMTRTKTIVAPAPITSMTTRAAIAVGRAVTARESSG